MIVTVGSTKGGSGKTTISLNLAISLAIRGRDVWLIDGDRQASAATAITLRAESRQRPGIACSAYCEGAQLRSQVLQQSKKFEEVIIDVGGRDSSALRAALTVTDVLIVPFQPRSIDVWALSDIAALVREANALRDGLKVYALLNSADARGDDNRDAIAAVGEHSELTYLDAPLGRRKAFANASGSGLCVDELKTSDQKASAELAHLLGQVYGLYTAGDIDVTKHSTTEVVAP